MSIPLDRLYHYLDGLVSDDIIIYRFYPHGSKKLENLIPLHGNDCSRSWLDYMLMPTAVFNDQEPLNFDLYTRPHVIDYVNQTHRELFTKNSTYMQFMPDLNLRVRVDFPLNCFDKTILVHSEKNSLELKKYQNNNFVGVYYWSHAVIARDWFRYAEHDNKLGQKQISKDFLIYNRAWSGTREYRVKLAEMLIDHGLVNHCNVKFSAYDNNLHYTQYCFVNSDFLPARKDIELCIPANTHESSASAEYCTADYQQTAIELVLETLFDDQRHHLTEKTLRAIACGQPFMLAATAGSLQYLRDYGFETFGDYINENYDTVVDPLQRLQCIVQEMKRISLLSTSDKNTLYHNLNQVAQRNKQRFFSQQWADQIIAEFVDNWHRAYTQLSQSLHGSYWLNVLNSNDANITRAFTQAPDSANSRYNPEQGQKLLKLLKKHQ